MAFDQAKFAAKAKATHAVAATPAFTPDPENAEACAQVDAAVADAVKRAAVHSIALAIGERAAELWAGAHVTPAEMLDSAEGATDLDGAVLRAIAFYLATVQE